MKQIWLVFELKPALLFLERKVTGTVFEKNGPQVKERRVESSVDKALKLRSWLLQWTSRQG